MNEIKTIEFVDEDDHPFKFHDNLNFEGGQVDIGEDLKAEVRFVLKSANELKIPLDVPGYFTTKYNFFQGNIRYDEDIEPALNELRKQKERCNWQLHTICAECAIQRFEECHWGNPKFECFDSLHLYVRCLRCLFLIFPCHLAFIELVNIVERHTELIGLSDEEIPDFHLKYVKEGGWCSLDDFDDEIWDAWDWLHEWMYNSKKKVLA